MPKFFIAVLLNLFVVFANASECPEHYPEHPIKIPNTIELCNSFFVVLFDKENKGPVLTSEKLKVSSPIGELDRVDSMRKDSRLGLLSPASSQYTHSGYDRGHMVPSDDASTLVEMRDTFFMSNMTPQAPKLNRGEWKKLELQLRTKHLKSTTDTYIITIAVYGSTKVNGLGVPEGYWKILFKDSSREYYYSENSNTNIVTRYSSPAVQALRVLD